MIAPSQRVIVCLTSIIARAEAITAQGTPSKGIAPAVITREMAMQTNRALQLRQTCTRPEEV